MIEKLGETQKFLDIKSTIKITEKYGCFNRNMVNASVVRDGYVREERTISTHRFLTMVPKYIVIPFVMSRDCKHSALNKNDPKCFQCIHQVV